MQTVILACSIDWPFTFLLVKLSGLHQLVRTSLSSGEAGGVLAADDTFSDPSNLVITLNNHWLLLATD